MTDTTEKLSPCCGGPIIRKQVRDEIWLYCEDCGRLIEEEEENDNDTTI